MLHPVSALHIEMRKLPTRHSRHKVTPSFQLLRLPKLGFIQLLVRDALGEAAYRVADVAFRANKWISWTVLTSIPCKFGTTCTGVVIHRCEAQSQKSKAVISHEIPNLVPCG
mmetsp:Transcript_18214/g.54960  ORF Transcript_18214/g.54960 Transcript_18214/m.54960 type:complete len:112 (+) Transcript_18214:2493-2828(+)